VNCMSRFGKQANSIVFFSVEEITAPYSRIKALLPSSLFLAENASHIIPFSYTSARET